MMRAHPRLSAAAVDIPVGLVERGARECDAEARRLLGPRRSSVFDAPIRATLAAASHDDASRLRFSVEGKRMSIQAWNILDKVVEMDEALRKGWAPRRRVWEVHPELAFHHLNGGRPMAHSKKSAAGKAERLKLLRRHFGRAVDCALAARRALGCASDDVIDAFACLWTARRIAAGAAVSVPKRPPRDAMGIRMAITA